MNARSGRSKALTGGTIAAVLVLSALGAAPAMADDTLAPHADSLSAYGIAGGDAGYTAQGRRVYVCASNVMDDGAPPSGINSVSMNISSFGLPYNGYDLTQMPMTNDPANAGLCPGDTFKAYEDDWPANKVLAEGTYPYSVTMTDNAHNSSTQSSTIIVDNTAPKGTDVQSTNGGATSGKPEQGDKVTFSFSEIMNRFLASETPRNVVVHIDNTYANDTLTVWNAYNTGQDGYSGTIKLGGDYVSANRTFGASGTKSTLVRNGSQVILTLGTPSGTTNRVTANGRMSWTPGGSTDRAGNPVVKTPVSQTGTAHPQF